MQTDQDQGHALPTPSGDHDSPGEAGDETPKVCSVHAMYITPEEEQILAELRQLGDRARRLKARIRELESEARTSEPVGAPTDRAASGGGRADDEALLDDLRAADVLDEWRSCQDELVALRQARERLIPEKERAFHRKMVLLGHRPPDSGDDVEIR